MNKSVDNNKIIFARRMKYRTAWTPDEFQEAILEYLDGKPDKLNAMKAKRQAIKDMLKKS